MRHVLVTGGAGYIGSHVCKALAAKDIVPVTFDNLIGGHREAVRWGPLEVGDLLDEKRLNEVMRAYKFESVMHFAGLIAVGESVTDPALYYQNNVEGSLALLRSMILNDVKNIVFSSTAAVYGVGANESLKETSPLAPINPYGRSKLFVEDLLRDFDEAYGIRHICLRYFNACGADPAGETGEWHQPETHLVPRIMMAADGLLDEMPIYGDDFDTFDGTCIRDYIHVSDLAFAHVQALNILNAGASGSYNVGSGTGFSVKQMLDAATNITGKKFKVVIHPRRDGDPSKLVANIDAAVRDLSFKLNFTNLPNIIETAWNWHTHLVGHQSSPN
jgi:UDP-arabinose 4-epimerase